MSNETANEYSSVSPQEKRLTGLDILEKVQEYFYGDDELAYYFQSFAIEKCDIIDLTSDECKLEYTLLYNQYKDMFERKMEEYIENTLHGSVHDMLNALKEKMDQDQNSNEAVFGQILLAVSDFDIFMTIMREAKQAKDRK